MLAITLALGSSLCGGLADFVAGLTSRRLPVVVVLFVSQTIGAVVAALVVIVLARLLPDLHGSACAAISGVGIAVALSALYQGLKEGAMSIVATIAGTGAAIPVLVGLVRGEEPGALPLLGIAMAMLGIALVSSDKPGNSPAHRSRGSILLAFTAAAGFGTEFVALDLAVEANDPASAVLVSRAASVALVLIGTALIARPSTAIDPSDISVLCAIGLLDLAAITFFAYSAALGLLSIVSVLASLPALTTVVLARSLLGERVRPLQTVGIGTTLVAITLIAAG